MLSRLAEAQQVYEATVRRYNGFSGSVNEIDLAQAEANLALAQAQFITEETYQILQAGPDPDEITLAEGRKFLVHRRGLALAENSNPSAEQLAIAQAQVDAAFIHFEITTISI